MAVDPGKIRQAANALIARAGEMANTARALPSIVEGAGTGTARMQQFVEQVRSAALVAGAQQDSLNQVAVQMIAYADMIEKG
jgi:hypothetical protein